LHPFQDVGGIAPDLMVAAGLLAIKF